MTTQIDNVKGLVSAVRMLAMESPECSYAGPVQCFYTVGRCTNGSEGCIVGQGLIRCGLATTKDLALVDSDGAVAADTLLRLLKIDLPQEDIHWLSLVQETQDGGYSWSHAVAEADRHVAEAGHLVTGNA